MISNYSSRKNSESRKHILIIEDHEGVRKLISWRLSQKFKVTVKSNSIEGLKYLYQGNLPDLILLDINTSPEEDKDGLTFLKKIKINNFFKEIPVFILSGDNSDKIINQTMSLGAEEFISKPFNPFELEQSIDLVFASSNDQESKAELLRANTIL